MVLVSIHIKATTHSMDDDCPICYESLGNGEIRTTDCKHAFHRECLRTWVKKKKVYGPVPCPMCRTVLKKPSGPVRKDCASITLNGTPCKFRARVGHLQCGHHIKHLNNQADQLWIAVILASLTEI
jgi:hypothetical protein